MAGTPVAYPTFAFDGNDSEFGLKEVGETPETGYDLTNISCSGDTTGLVIGRYDGLTFVNGGGDGFDVGDTHFQVTIDAGENVTCTFENTKLTKVRVVKTVEGSSPSEDPAAWAEVDPPGIEFTIRTGASSNSNGATLDTGYATPNRNNGQIDFTVELLPGDYFLCERVPIGYDTSLQDGDWDGDGTLASSGIPRTGSTRTPHRRQSNEVVCVPFTVDRDDPATPIRSSSRSTTTCRSPAHHRLLEELVILRRQRQPGRHPRSDLGDRRQLLGR